MNFASRRWRLPTILYALVQLVLPGASAVIDGRLARDGKDNVAHIEETTRQQCRPPHADDCIFCRYLSTRATTSNPPPDVSAAVAVREHETFVVADVRSLSPLEVRSRAPPPS